MSDVAIMWFRRDFRLADNPALDHARQHHRVVVPVYIHDRDANGDWALGAASQWWLHHALIDLNGRLESRGSRLVVRAGPAQQVLWQLIGELHVAAVYWNRLYEPALVARDSAIKRALKREQLLVRSFRASMLFEPWELLRDGSEAYKVFTPYWNRMQRQWRGIQRCPEPRDLPPVAASLESLPVEALKLLPDHDWPESLADHWEIGELAARRQLDGFAEQCVRRYAELRDRPDQAGTSRLSPYLHFGHVSPAQAVEALSPGGDLPGGKGALSFVRELAWREFSMMLLYHVPKLTDAPMQPKFMDFPWRDGRSYRADLEAWQTGRTGVPLVDAGMRQLWRTGWMHNRVRMVVASFLTKNLLIPWQRGARWFWETLVDADLANNTQGWQWTAGCGADAAPYFRVFNPELQAQKFDPEARYIRRWCPELEGLDLKQMHRLDAAARQSRGYPEMRLDLKQSRRRALAAFQSISERY